MKFYLIVYYYILWVLLKVHNKIFQIILENVDVMELNELLLIRMC